MSHQIANIKGRHKILATVTSSEKSLIYNVGVIYKITANFEYTSVAHQIDGGGGGGGRTRRIWESGP